MSYDVGFYDMIRDGCLASAREVAPRVAHLLRPRSVVDVGCGEGAWLLAFSEHGVQDFLGLDGAHVDPRRLLVDPGRFCSVDLERPFSVERTFDLAVSLEVAEHLSPGRAGTFIDDLVALAPITLFSAAIPGQGGVGHRNEQWPDYWAARFEERGRWVSGALRFAFWNNERVENWYRQNLLLAATPDLAARLEPFQTPLAQPWRLVHPVLWDSRR